MQPKTKGCAGRQVSAEAAEPPVTISNFGKCLIHHRPHKEDPRSLKRSGISKGEQVGSDTRVERVEQQLAKSEQLAPSR
jgi:hypothetical protein